MTVRISTRPRGPLVVEFDEPIEVKGLDGQPRDLSGLTRVLFCRCAASKTRPYCDGSHNRTNFEAPEPGPA